jgi:hypothetical protein
VCASLVWIKKNLPEVSISVLLIGIVKNNTESTANKYINDYDFGSLESIFIISSIYPFIWVFILNF